MTDRQLDFSDVRLYGVATANKGDETLLERIEQALRGGTDAIQLRSYSLTDREFLALSKSVKAVCEKAKAYFIVDNRVDLAQVLQADGVHLGHQDLPIGTARAMLGHRRIIGASTHSLPEELEAQRQGADYVSCGPIWATPTKPDYRPVGLSLIGFYRAALKIPFVAIGGIDFGNIDQVVDAGAAAVAVVRALFQAPDAEVVARGLREKILKNKLLLS